LAELQLNSFSFNKILIKFRFSFTLVSTKLHFTLSHVTPRSRRCIVRTIKNVSTLLPKQDNLSKPLTFIRTNVRIVHWHVFLSAGKIYISKWNYFNRSIFGWNFDYWIFTIIILRHTRSTRLASVGFIVKKLSTPQPFVDCSVSFLRDTDNAQTYETYKTRAACIRTIKNSYKTRLPLIVFTGTMFSDVVTRERR
jgi:hypothetical protein